MQAMEVALSTCSTAGLNRNNNRINFETNQFKEIIMRAGKFLAGCCLALMAACNLQAQTPQAPLTLRQCVEMALKNNMDVKLADLNNQRDNISLRGAKGEMLPNLIGN